MTMTDATTSILEATPPDGCDETQSLYSWSLNYDAGKGPFTLFLDLIGYSQDEFETLLYDLSDPRLGYIELGMLAGALNEYLDNPEIVRDYVHKIVYAELGDD